MFTGQRKTIHCNNLLYSYWMCIWLLQITMQHMIVSYKRTPPRSWMWWPNLNNRKSLLGALFHKQISPGIDRRKQIITSNNVWQVNSNGRRVPRMSGQSIDPEENGPRITVLNAIYNSIYKVVFVLLKWLCQWS